MRRRALILLLKLKSVFCLSPVLVRNVAWRKGWATDSFGSCRVVWGTRHQGKGLALGMVHLSLAHSFLSVGVSPFLLPLCKWNQSYLIFHDHIITIQQIAHLREGDSLIYLDFVNSASISTFRMCFYTRNRPSESHVF